MKQFTFFSDSSHGWLAVKLKELIELGVADKISTFSYVSKAGTTVYLEEDRDATIFIKAYELKHGPIVTVDSYKDGQSHIRNYRRYEVSK